MRATFLSVFTLAAALASAAPQASAFRGDCGQPASEGENATATDSLAILRAAIGATPCSRECICDTDSNGSVSAADALRSLRNVASHDITLTCECPPTPCTSAVLTVAPGSHVDMGWNGLAHGTELPIGGSLTVRIARKCADAPEQRCEIDSDCPVGACVNSCDCGSPENSVCEISGPVLANRCRSDFAPCSTNADCKGPLCAPLIAVPVPVSARNTPLCIRSLAAGDLSGTVDFATGSIGASIVLTANLALGTTIDQPCPRCGPPEHDPVVGDQFVCEGGATNGAVCTAQAVSRIFGGTSEHCRVASGFALFSPYPIRLLELTTGQTSRTASFLCFPHVATKCVDTLVPCSTNADCLRCTADLSPCTTNGDCGENGVCAEAPAQPISCGVYCHCGFCDEDPMKPCFANDQCDAPATCRAEDENHRNQELPNSCSSLICGELEAERCCSNGQPGCDYSTPQSGTCSEAEYIACAEDGACAVRNAGACEVHDNRCFGHVIERTGSTSPLGGHCVEDGNMPACETNADCSSSECVNDTLVPVIAGVTCLGWASLFEAWGLPGPASLTLHSLVRVCRCGDGILGCAEECDDGDFENGDGCDATCRNEP